MTRKTALGLLAATTTLAFAGCGSDDKSKSTASSPTSTASTTKAPGTTGDEKDKQGKKGKAKVKFKSPKQGATVGTTFKVRVKVKRFRIDAKDVGKANKPNRGHLHFSLDNGKYDFPKYSGANGVLAQKLGVEGKYSPSVKPNITYSHIPPGRHTLEVYLANNDHSSTGVEARVTFTVK